MNINESLVKNNFVKVSKRYTNNVNLTKLFKVLFNLSNLRKKYRSKTGEMKLCKI